MAQKTSLPPALENFDALPNDAFVKLPVLQLIYSCSPATVWRRVKVGALPAPMKLGARSTCWRVGDLREHLASLSQ